MGKGGDEFARGRVPELGTVICARRQDPSAVRAKRRIIKKKGMVKGSDELARGHIPELVVFVWAYRQDPGAVGLNAAHRTGSPL